MKLNGAEIRNVYKLCNDIKSSDNNSNIFKINIPFYQRPFNWDEEKIETLINDFVDNNKIQNSKNKYFAGSILSAKNNEGYDLIDGQQRITTVYLINYVKFLLLRSIISQHLKQKKIAQLQNCFDEIKKAGKYLCLSIEDDINLITKYIMEDIDSSYNNDDFFESKLSTYKKNIYLPDILEDSPDYDNKYYTNLIELFSKFKPCLKYSRNSYNDKLIKAMSQIRIRVNDEYIPYINDLKEDNQDVTILKFTKAIKKIFNIFKDFYSNCDPKTKLAVNMVLSINDFLENVVFCVIQTADIDDAYTLFEVLNDRALALDDLDLIKNMFYKKYCSFMDTNDTDDKLDKNIDTLDEIWVDKVFSPNMPDLKKKLISYFGTVFLTGSTEIKYNEKEQYRKNLSKFLNNNFINNYSYVNIKNHFTIFNLIQKLISKLNIKGRENNSLDAERMIDKSIVYRSFLLLNAFKYYGVMAALINMILVYFMIKNKLNFDKEIEEDKFENFIEEIFRINIESDTTYKKLCEVANDLWSLSLLSKDFIIPREYAKTIITSFNYSNLKMMDNLPNFYSRAKKEYINWINLYEKGNNDFRIKLLYYRLITFDKNGDYISSKAAHIILDSKYNYDLDHLEPVTIDVNHQNEYFFPPYPLLRDNIINKLGNIMLLEESNNSKKRNAALCNFFKHYQNMGLGEHWIIKEIKQLLIENNINNIPNANFFAKRLDRLKNYFYTIIMIKYDEKEKKIEDLL